MRVNDLAQRADVTPDTVRFYTRTGLLNPQKDPFNGYKQYGKGDYKRLMFIVKARHLGFSVSEIKEIVDLSDHGNSPCCRVREIVRRRIDEANKHIRELQMLVSRMETAAATWENMPDGEPTGDSVCNLIEMWQEPEMGAADWEPDVAVDGKPKATAKMPSHSDG